MGSPISANNPTIVSAFHSLLGHQLLVVLAIAALLALGFMFARMALLGRDTDPNADHADHADGGAPEPAARRLLRIGFGALWLIDGLLQMQASMPIGLPGEVITPAAATSPSWLRHLVDFGTLTWTNHPVEAAVSVVWIQVGIAALLLLAPRGRWSRLGGLASAAWGLVIWVFGEALGGLLAPGASWLLGAPGAALCYVVAGGLLVLPERAWNGARLGRAVLRAFGAVLVAFAVLQAWPGRGYWRGDGPLHAMTAAMARTPQPAVFAGLVRGFARLDATAGPVVNLVAVLALAGIGLALASGRRHLLRPALGVLGVLGVADWLVVQDLGVFGGVGTDPNSMLPLLLLAGSGALAVLRVPADSAAAVTATRPRGVRFSPMYLFRAAGAVGALGVTVLGAVPMAVASASPTASPLLAESIGGSSVPENAPATPFRLQDASGATVSLASLRGKVVLLSFLDPVCTTDCPIIAQEMREADVLLGAAARNVELVAIDANPLFHGPAYLDAFDREQNLTTLANWHFLTGGVDALKTIWTAYGIELTISPGGAMVAHSDLAYVIDRQGNTRFVLNTTPGPGSVSSKSSFAALFASDIRQVLRGS